MRITAAELVAWLDLEVAAGRTSPPAARLILERAGLTDPGLRRRIGTDKVRPGILRPGGAVRGRREVARRPT
jgi:hypothetical protein